MSLESKILSFKDLCSMDLMIPDYQRPYVWDKTRVEQLLENINNNEFLLGSIVLYKLNNTYKIIDGQQRLTTIKLILKALNAYDNFLKNTKYYHQISHINIKKNYKIIENYLKNKNNFLNKLEQIKFIRISTDNIKNAFLFFENINTKGKELKNYDLIKAFWAINSNSELINYYVKKYNEFIKDGKKYEINESDGVKKNYFQFFLENLAMIRRFENEHNFLLYYYSWSIDIIDEYCKITPFSTGLKQNNLYTGFNNGISFFAWVQKQYESRNILLESSFLNKLFASKYPKSKYYDYSCVYTQFALVVYLDKFIDGDFDKLARMIVRIMYYKVIIGGRTDYVSLIADLRRIAKMIIYSSCENDLITKLNNLINQNEYQIKSFKRLKFLEKEFSNYNILGVSYDK